MKLLSSSLFSYNRYNLCLFASSLSLLLFITACKNTRVGKSNTKDPVVATLGEKPIHFSEFKFSYEKSLQKDNAPYSEKSVNDYLQKYINFKLLILDAEKEGIPQSKGFKREMAGYEEILAQPYLVDKETEERLMKEAYEHLKEEVNVSHIMVEVQKDAEPKDTMVAYEKILDIRRKAISGEKFSTLASKYSQDEKSKDKAGNLGWFKALQMVYNIEEASYNTPKGDISDLIRTKFGYHFLKVLDRRQAKGKISTAHIMISLPQKPTKKDSIESERKIKQIYQKLQSGESWDKLCAQFSEDATSKDKGGKLPPFAVGEAILAFEKNAFELESVGSYTKPFRTPYGWHIVKLLKKESLASYSDMKPYLKQKVSRDSRLEVSQEALIKKVKQENNFIENKALLAEVAAIPDANLLNSTWVYPKDHQSLSKVLFSFENKKYNIVQRNTVEDLFKYLQEKQVPRDDLKSIKHVFFIYYNRFKRQQTLLFETSLLPEKYNEYKMLKKEYKEGMMIFEMRERIYQKSFADTTGLRKHYEGNKAKYQWKERAKVKIYEALNKNVYESLKKKFAERSYPVQDLSIPNVYFQRNKDYLEVKYLSALDKVVNYLKGDEQSVVVLRGHIDVGENDTISKARLKPIYQYIASKKIDVRRIAVIDEKDQKPVDASNRSRNRRVEVTLYSAADKVLEDNLNKSNPLNLKITTGLFEKGKNKYLDQVKWEPGVHELKADGGKYVYIDIKYVSEPRIKKFRECRGEVLNDFQKSLEKNKIKALKEQYPVKINQKQVNKLIRN